MIFEKQKANKQRKHQYFLLSHNEPLSGSCAIAEAGNFWHVTGQSNLAKKTASLVIVQLCGCEGQTLETVVVWPAICTGKKNVLLATVHDWHWLEISGSVRIKRSFSNVKLSFVYLITGLKCLTSYKEHKTKLKTLLLAKDQLV